MSEIWTLRRALRAGPVLLAVLLAASLSAMAATSEPDSAGPASPSSAPLHFGGVPVHDLAQDLFARMATEAARARDVLPPDPGDPMAPPDSATEEVRSREAERIIARAVDRTLEGRADLLGRTTPGLRAAYAWLEGLGRSRDRPGPGIEAQSMRPANDGAAALPRFAAGFGLRIDAHPRLVLSSRLAGFRGRLELPLLGESPRLSLERSFGARGRALLTSGLDRGGHGWASIGISLSF